LETIAVVIPVRNGRDYIKAAVESVLDQTDEIVVVDDGSTDGSGDAVSGLGAYVKVMANPGPHHGASIARNLGVAHSTTSLIAFLDADDLSRPRRLEVQAQALADNPDAAMVFCDLEYMDAAGTPTGTIIDFPEFKSEGFFGRMLERNRIGSTSAAMVRRSIFETMGGFDEKLAYNEEYDLWLRITRDYPVLHVARPDVLYRLHGNNISRSRDGQHKNEIRAIAKHDDKTILTALVATHGDYMAALMALAQIYFRIGRLDDCRKTLDRWTGDYPLEPFLRGNLALINKDPASAMSYYEKCVASDPTFAAAWNNLGICRWAGGDESGASEAIHTAYALAPNYTDARWNMQVLVTGKDWTRMRPTWVRLRRQLKPEREE
jgi:glycosyltransferase involved in cell wall biosynthesis